MVSWMTLWLASEHVGRSFAHEREGVIDGGLSDEEVREYITKVAAPESVLAKRVAMLPKRDVQMLNLSADWLSIFLPHVLQKINRRLDLVASGPYFGAEMRRDLWHHDGSAGGAGAREAAGHADDARQAVDPLHRQGRALALLRVRSPRASALGPKGPRPYRV